MKLEDELRIVKTDVTNSGMTSKGYPSVNNKSIYDLIDLLNNDGVLIELKDSKKHVLFIGEKQPVYIPIRTTFHNDDEVRILGYKIKGRKLEISLEDFDKQTSSSLNLGYIGGTKTRELGILVKLALKGTYEEGSILQTCKQVIQEFYQREVSPEELYSAVEEHIRSGSSDMPR